MLGFGAIGKRLAELLAPFGMRIYALRRQLRSEPGVHVVPRRPDEGAGRGRPRRERPPGERGDAELREQAPDLLLQDPGARFYNVGRGATVDQDALIEALHSGRVGAAYLDVMVPEPLPPGHPLWSAPRCYITPHTAGGRNDGELELVRHFLANLAPPSKMGRR
jgi:phosphoglycerate dehydrogenase-like enzyme